MKEFRVGVHQGACIPLVQIWYKFISVKKCNIIQGNIKKVEHEWQRNGEAGYLKWYPEKYIV